MNDTENRNKLYTNITRYVYMVNTNVGFLQKQKFEGNISGNISHFSH